jgi:hypothetical protein
MPSAATVVSKLCSVVVMRVILRGLPGRSKP